MSGSDASTSRPVSGSAASSITSASNASGAPSKVTRGARADRRVGGAQVSAAACGVSGVDREVRRDG
jgi:hypothetical protein